MAHIPILIDDFTGLSQTSFSTMKTISDNDELFHTAIETPTPEGTAMLTAYDVLKDFLTDAKGDFAGHLSTLNTAIETYKGTL